MKKAAIAIILLSAFVSFAYAGDIFDEIAPDATYQPGPWDVVSETKIAPQPSKPDIFDQIASDEALMQAILALTPPSRPTMSYQFNRTPDVQTGFVWGPNSTLPYTIYTAPSGPSWGMQFDSRGRSTIIIEPAPGIRMIY